jgi:hypothetical protein
MLGFLGPLVEADRASVKRRIPGDLEPARYPENPFRGSRKSCFRAVSPGKVGVETLVADRRQSRSPTRRSTPVDEELRTRPRRKGPRPWACVCTRLWSCWGVGACRTAQGREKMEGASLASPGDTACPNARGTRNQRRYLARVGAVWLCDAESRAVRAQEPCARWCGQLPDVILLSDGDCTTLRPGGAFLAGECASVPAPDRDETPDRTSSMAPAGRWTLAHRIV